MSYYSTFVDNSSNYSVGDNTYAAIYGDTTLGSIALINNAKFIFNNIEYSRINFDSDGSIRFNNPNLTLANYGYNPTNVAYRAFIGIFPFFADAMSSTNDVPSTFVRYKQFDDTLEIIYNTCHYYNVSERINVKVTLKLKNNINSGDIVFDFGNMVNYGRTYGMGYSFGTGNVADINKVSSLLTPTSLTYPKSPIFISSDNSIFSNKRLIISPIFQGKPRPTITNFTVPVKTYGDAPFTLTDPSSNNNGSFTYTSSDLTVATISGKTVTILKAGTTTITATQAATLEYASGTTTAILTVNIATPTITNFSVPVKAYGDAPFTLTDPSSNSNGSFTYTSSDLTVATISGKTVTILKAGTTTITVSQVAASNYAAGTTTTTFTVNLANPTITNFTVPVKSYRDDPFTLVDPSSNSPGSFTYTSSDMTVATISGKTVTILTGGTTTITVNQSAVANYYTSGTSTATFTVNRNNPIVTNFSVPVKPYGNPPFTLTDPSSNSPGSFIYTSSDITVASIIGNTVIPKGAGTTTITATQVATSNYNSTTISTQHQVTVTIRPIIRFSGRSSSVRIQTTRTLPVLPPQFQGKSLFSNNLTGYKVNSLPTSGAGTVSNSRAVGRRT